MRVEIKKHDSDEVVDLNGGFVSNLDLPQWVLDQMGVSNAAELMRSLDQYTPDYYYDGQGNHQGPDDCGVSCWRDRVTAQDFANELEFPVVFYAGNGSPAGVHIALLEDTELPFDLSDVEGEVVDGVFDAKNLSTEPHGKGDWNFSDWNQNLIYKIQVVENEDIWREQNEEYQAAQ